MTELADRHIVVVGMMAAGKTTLARALADAVGRTMHDSDVAIEAALQVTGRDVAMSVGVDELHRVEEEILAEHLAAAEPAVVAAAASVIESQACRALLAERAFVVWVDVPMRIVAGRLGRRDHRRGMSPSELEERYRIRTPLFASVADVRVDSTVPIDRKVAAVLAVLQAPARVDDSPDAPHPPTARAAPPDPPLPASG